jgi:hypothetical protein
LIGFASRSEAEKGRRLIARKVSVRRTCGARLQDMPAQRGAGGTSTASRGGRERGPGTAAASAQRAALGGGRPAIGTKRTYSVAEYMAALISTIAHAFALL